MAVPEQIQEDIGGSGPFWPAGVVAGASSFDAQMDQPERGIIPDPVTGIDQAIGEVKVLALGRGDELFIIAANGQCGFAQYAMITANTGPGEGGLWFREVGDAILFGSFDRWRMIRVAGMVDLTRNADHYAIVIGGLVPIKQAGRKNDIVVDKKNEVRGSSLQGHVSLSSERILGGDDPVKTFLPLPAR